jgi:hypothetical protein
MAEFETTIVETGPALAAGATWHGEIWDTADVLAETNPPGFVADSVRVGRVPDDGPCQVIVEGASNNGSGWVFAPIAVTSLAAGETGSVEVVRIEPWRYVRVSILNGDQAVPRLRVTEVFSDEH